MGTGTPPTPLPDRRILLLGSAPDLQELAQVLYGRGYDVCRATTLREAVALRSQCRPGMVLADLRTPSPVTSPELAAAMAALKGESVLVGLVHEANGSRRTPDPFDHLVPEPQISAGLTRFLETVDSLWPKAGSEPDPAAGGVACRLQPPAPAS